jgi:flagellar protein FliO/FliZ
MEFTDYIGTIGALIFVLVLIWGLSVAARRFGLVPGAHIMGKTGRQKRLKILDSLALDTKRRVILIAKDNEEHLILLGPSSEVIIDKSTAPSAPDDTSDVIDQEHSLS